MCGPFLCGSVLFEAPQKSHQPRKNPQMPSLRTRRTALSAISSLTILCSLAFANAAEAATSGYLSYEEVGGYAYINGCDGPCPDSLEIPATIEGLPVANVLADSFASATGVTSLTLDEGLTTIGTSAFSGMTGVKTVSLPSTLTSIGGNAFGGMSGVTSLTLPDGLQSIDVGGLSGMSGIKSITLPAGLTSIGGQAFYGMSSLKAVYFLGNAPSVGQEAFQGVASGARAYISSGDLTGYGGEGADFNGLAVTYDATAPGAPGSFAAEDALVSNPVSTTVDFTLAEEGGTVECRFNDGEWGACTSVDGTAGKFTVTDLTGGEQSISVRQTDYAGNTSEVGSVYLAPKLIGGPVGSVVKGNGVAFQIAHAEGATLLCKLRTVLSYADYAPCQDWVDNGSFSSDPQGSSYSHISLEPGETANGLTTRTLTACGFGSCAGGDGNNTLAFEQVINGQTSLESKATWTQDTTGPNAPTFSGKPDSFTKSRSASIGFTADEANVTFECSVDDGAYSACTSPQSFSDLPDGAHSLAVKGTDALGNVGTEGKASWTVDTVAPGPPTVTSPGSSNSSGTTMPFNATGEAGATFWCSLDGGEFVSCPKATPGPGDQSTLTVGWNTKLHWGEASDWASLKWGTRLPYGGGYMYWVANRDRSEFPDGATLAAIWAGNSASEVYGKSCANFNSTVGAWGYKLIVGVPGDSQPTVYNSFDADCSSTLAEVQPSAPAQFSSLGAGDHTLLVKQVDAAGNESQVTSKNWFVGEVGAPRLLSKVGLKFNFKTKVTTLSLNAVADTRVRGNSIKWVEYSNHPKRPAANAVQAPSRIRAYARTVNLTPGQVAFWVRFKDTHLKWSGWYRTRFKPGAIGW